MKMFELMKNQCFFYFWKFMFVLAEKVIGLLRVLSYKGNIKRVKYKKA